ncbi:MAG: hypothetical protein M3304_03190 [Actinomycetota bacterium]|nr:hypothetical protein [Actinomycetota bacterium]
MKKLRGVIALAAVVTCAVGATSASAGNGKSTTTEPPQTTAPIVLPGFFRGP